MSETLPNDVTIRRVDKDFGSIMVRTTNNRYIFSVLEGDEIRGGSKADIEGLYAYTGESSSSNYISEDTLDDVPQAVIEAAARFGHIVEGVDGGWANWDGRPEFSTSYVDISDADVVAEKR